MATLDKNLLLQRDRGRPPRNELPDLFRLPPGLDASYAARFAVRKENHRIPHPERPALHPACNHPPVVKPIHILDHEAKRPLGIPSLLPAGSPSQQRLQQGRPPEPFQIFCIPGLYVASFPGGDRQDFPRGYFQAAQVFPDLPLHLTETGLLPADQIHLVHRHDHPGNTQKRKQETVPPCLLL